MSKERLEELHKFYINGIINVDDLVRELVKLEQLNWALINQNKRYREAREIIEQVYKESYVRNAYGYEDGYLDGLDTAINIIDEALEEESE